MFSGALHSTTTSLYTDCSNNLYAGLPKSFGIQQKKAGPSAWICTTSYLPNALQSAAKKEELTAASPPDVKIGAKKF